MSEEQEISDLDAKLKFLLQNFIYSDDGKFTFPDGDTWDCVQREIPPRPEEEILRECYPELDTMSWGQLRDALINELADVKMLSNNCSVVYDHVTGGKASNPKTLPGIINGLHDDHVTELVNRDMREHLQNHKDDISRALNFVISQAEINGEYNNHHALDEAKSKFLDLLKQIFGEQDKNP